jgi:ribonucleoside-diphosphate reductase alpha chain
VSLQYGVPVESLVRKFEHVRFEPSGMTRNPEIPIAKSLVDYIFRWLAMEFVPGYRSANAPKRNKGSEVRVQGSGKVESDSTLNPEPSTPNPAAPRPGNGHGPRIEPDTARPFDYDDTDPAPPHAAAERSAAAVPVDKSVTSPAVNRLTIAADPVSQQGAELQSDAPACDVCGSITVRSGTCYKCLNCGNSMGCS